MQKLQNLKFHSWIDSFRFGKGKEVKGTTGFVYFIGSDDARLFESVLKEHSLSWQTQSIKDNERELIYFSGQKGPVWILRKKKNQKDEKSHSTHNGFMKESEYSVSRDQFGNLVSHFKAHQLKSVQMTFVDTTEEQELGAFVGLEVAAYNFRSMLAGKIQNELPVATLIKQSAKNSIFSKAILKDASARAKAINLARHLVNLPPNELNPKTFSEIATQSLKFSSAMKVQVWNTARLEKEKMGLHLAVGQGAEHGPCMVHLRYRPKGKAQRKPIAFVGKGITFDTGGLDLKPSSAMRLMKKDMGGAASVLATALWVAESAYPHPCDFYLALAENSVDAKSFRPSDVLVARNGISVEIDNTDAEGRLVLADCLDVAVSQKSSDEPEIVIDVATLTGAIKVGLGAEIAGLFCNDDPLAEQLTRAGQRAGDLNWRMPLFEKYMGSLSSNFADYRNSGESFGGAITAALFLQKFVRTKKWAHLDIYAWADKANGAILQSGGNGQAVQCLIEFLKM